VTLVVRGADLTLSLPRRLQIMAVNTHLRYELDRLTSDPYGAGWLFRAKAVPPRPGDRPPAPLLEGEAAQAWMRAEVRRLATLVHERILPGPNAGQEVMADGGAGAPDLLDRLDRDQIVELLAAVFPSSAAGGAA
jgi:hypothetical protein